MHAHPHNLHACHHVIMHIEYASRDGVYQKMAIQNKYTDIDGL